MTHPEEVVEGARRCPPRERDAGGAAERREYLLGQKTNEPWLVIPAQAHDFTSSAPARASYEAAMLGRR